MVAAEVIVAIDVADGELGGALFSEFFFGAVELGKSAKIGRAVIVAALVKGGVGLDFPAIERFATMRAPEFGAFGFAQAALDRRDLAADLTAQLRAEFAVVEGKILARRSAVLTLVAVGNVAFRTAAFDGKQRPTALGLIIGAQFPPVERRRDGPGRRRRGLRGIGIDDELAIVRMLLVEVIADRHVATATRQHGRQHGHDPFDLRTEKLPANPGRETFDSAHKCGLPRFLSPEAPCLNSWGETTHFFRKRNVLSALMTQRTENF